MLPQLMISELTVLQKCVHPNIMNVTELLEDDDCFYIACELLEGGELFDRIVQVQSFNEVQAAEIIHQVLLAINYMHGRNITHRDLKPENILLESKDVNKLTVKLADFGFSCFFDPDKGLDLVLGSPLYMAPEIIKISENKAAKGTYNEKVDIWSIGVITYMLMTGRNPFPGKTKQAVK
jgi:calcium-dependent protein kinase